MEVMRLPEAASQAIWLQGAQAASCSTGHKFYSLMGFRRLRWLGQTARQGRTILPKGLTHSRLPSKASRGRLPKRWTDYVREGIEGLKLLLKWAQLAQDRKPWRNKIQDLLGTHPAPCGKCVIDLLVN